jgi:hypothetical protein
MGENREDHGFIVNAKYLQLLGEGSLLQARLFRHRELLQSVPHSPVVKQKELIQTLHYHHFSNAPVLVLLTDPKYEEDFLIQSHLESCTAKEIRCRWPQEAIPVPTNITPLNLIVDDGLSLVLLPICVIDRYEEGFSAAIPEEGRLLGKRQARRHRCGGINATVTQSGFLARGDLLDFSPFAFRVRLIPDANVSFTWMNKKNPFSICLQEDERILFSGPCRCIRQMGGPFEKELVLAPLENEINRFQKQKKRNPRLHVMPPPSLRFEHPFFKKPVQRDVVDMTAAGFAVEERTEDALLLPGMIIPNMEICYAGMMEMTCDTQVIYRREVKKGRVRCGLAILNMDFRTYLRLGHIVAHTEDPHASFGAKIEMDALWEFFFDTGFIYPRKYYFLQSSREAFKETYRRLYREDQEIAANFTCGKNGRIYGHLSMIRAYQRAWMIQHLAARSMNGRKIGLTMLKHIHRFFEGFSRYPAIRMNYMLIYFRPENHFPNLFFGGFARNFNNPHGCSMDLFSYRNQQMETLQIPLPDGWRFADFSARHLPELERFYRQASGGLLLDVLGFNRSNGNDEPLSAVYRRHGFLREWNVHVLTQNDTLKAVLIANRSDIGISLSEFLNSIKIIVTDPDGLPWEILQTALTRLTPLYPNSNVPLMIYPATYPGTGVAPAEKEYLLWILDTQYGREYKEFIQRKTKLTIRFLFKYILRKMLPK